MELQDSVAGALPNIFSSKAPGAALPASPAGRQDVAFAYKKLQLELRAVKNKADISGKKAEYLIKELHKTVAAQKEQLQEQGEAMRQMQRALKNYQLVDMQQQRSITKTASTADSQIRALQIRLRDLELQHQKALEVSQERLDRSKRERQALKLALATISSHAMGGIEATGDDVAADMEAALSEGSEPLPRNPGVWMQLKYDIDSQGNLVVGSKTAGTAMKPFAMDGARGVAALTSQVSRLYRQRTDLSAAQKEGAQQIAHMQSILDNIDIDFSVVGQVLQGMIDQVHAVVAYCGMPPLELDTHVLSSTPRKVSDRLRIVWQVVRQLCGGLLSLSATLRSPEDGPVHPNVALYRFRQAQGPDERTGNQLFGDYDALLIAAMRLAADAAAANPQPPTSSAAYPARRPGAPPSRGGLMSRGGPTGSLHSTAPPAPPSSRSTAAAEPGAPCNAAPPASSSRPAPSTTAPAPAPVPQQPQAPPSLPPVAEEPKPVKHYGHAPGEHHPPAPTKVEPVQPPPETTAHQPSEEPSPGPGEHVEMSSPGIEGSTVEIVHEEDAEAPVHDAHPDVAEPDAACVTSDTSAKVDQHDESSATAKEAHEVADEDEAVRGGPVEEQQPEGSEAGAGAAGPEPAVAEEVAEDEAVPAEPAADKPALDSDDSMNAADEEFEPIYGE